MSTASSTAGTPSEPTRRDFLYIATGAFGAVGVGAVAVPLFAQMNPDASTLAAGAPIDLDLSKVQPGQQVVVRWRDHPIFVVNRTPDILKVLQDPKMIDQLSDPDSTVAQQPSYAQNWHRSIKPEVAVLVGICTHLGCIPGFDPQPNPTTPAADWMGGYFCPCHGSKYDLAGRVFRGVPAPYNLPVPPYRFVTDTMLRVGENPPDANSDFGLESVVQI